MSRSTTSTFTCPCGKVFNSLIYEYVNTAHDPQLQYTVLAGLLNVATCPSCGRRAALSVPFIYSDPAHSLLAYVHPSTDVPEEARQLIFEKLRTVYMESRARSVQSEESKQYVRTSSSDGKMRSQGTERSDVSDISDMDVTDELPTDNEIDAEQPDGMPRLHVLFGLDQLYELINSVLSQDERLGRLALSTQSRSDAERGRLLDIARKLASEMHCQVEVEDLPDEYTVWLYGSRRQIGALMRELASRG